MSRIVSFAVLLATIAVIGVMFFKVMAGFWLPLFLAALLVVIFKPVHRWIIQQCRGRQKLAALLTTLAIFMVFLVPLAWAISLAVTEAANLYSQPPDARLDARLSNLRKKVYLEMPHAQLLNDIQVQLGKLQPRLDEQQRPLDWDQMDPSRLLSDMDDVDRQITELMASLKAEEAADDPDSPPNATVTRSLQSLSELRQRLKALRDYIGPTDEIESGGDPDTYLELYRRASLQYGTFRRNLLGGPVRAWAIELANPGEEELRQWRNKATSYLQGWVLSLTGQTTALLASLLFGLFVMVLATYYFLIDGPSLIQAGMRLSPLDDKYERELLAEFDSVSRAVVVATLLSAIAQGSLATIGYYFAGFNSLFLLFVLTTLLALVPFVGAAAVWVPACLWLAFFVDGRMTAAIGLAIWGAVVVSMADNLIKPWVLHGRSNLHPLLGLLSVLGGLQALGPIGILVGPMVVAFLQTLLNMLHKELVHMDKVKSTNSPKPV